MMRRLILPAVLTLSLLVSLSATFGADFYGVDAGVLPTDPRPLSDAAAAAFDVTATSLGALNVIDFEGLPLGDFASLTVSPGVVATLTGTTTFASPALGGIRDAASADRVLGFNTTTGGTNFLSFVPVFDIGTATLDFAFVDPIQAWGAYITGLEDDIAGDLHVVYDDGVVRDTLVTSVSGGGSLFFGFTDAGAAISSVSLQLTGVTSSRDIFGVDDVRYVERASTSTPELSTWMLLACSGLAGLAMWRRRKA